jgi:hypothetical protein
MVGPLLPRVSDGGFLTSEETNSGTVQANLSNGFPCVFRKKGAAAETLRVTGPTIGTGALNENGSLQF